MLGFVLKEHISYDDAILAHFGGRLGLPGQLHGTHAFGTHDEPTGAAMRASHSEREEFATQETLFGRRIVLPHGRSFAASQQIGLIMRPWHGPRIDDLSIFVALEQSMAVGLDVDGKSISQHGPLHDSLPLTQCDVPSGYVIEPYPEISSATNWPQNL